MFVSHGKADAWLAGRIARSIQDMGASTFLDETDIAKGDDFKVRIRQEVARCSELVALFTPRHERFLTRGDEVSYFVGATSMIAGSETWKPSLAITRTRRGRGPICSSVSVTLLTVRPVATVSHVSPSPPSCTR